MLKVGDYVIPIDDDGDEYDHVWTPCRVTHLFKNGNLRASSDAGTLSWHGRADGFKLAPKRSRSLPIEDANRDGGMND